MTNPATPPHPDVVTAARHYLRTNRIARYLYAVSAVVSLTLTATALTHWALFDNPMSWTLWTIWILAVLMLLGAYLTFAVRRSRAQADLFDERREHGAPPLPSIGASIANWAASIVYVAASDTALRVEPSLMNPDRPPLLLEVVDRRNDRVYLRTRNAATAQRRKRTSPHWYIRPAATDTDTYGPDPEGRPMNNPTPTPPEEIPDR